MLIILQICIGLVSPVELQRELFKVIPIVRVINLIKDIIVGNVMGKCFRTLCYCRAPGKSRPLFTKIVSHFHQNSQPFSPK